MQQLLAASDKAGQAETALHLLCSVPATEAASLLAFSQPDGLQVGQESVHLAMSWSAVQCCCYPAAAAVAHGSTASRECMLTEQCDMQIIERGLRAGAAMMAGCACDTAWATYAGEMPSGVLLTPAPQL